MGRAGLARSEAAPGAKYALTASTGLRRPVASPKNEQDARRNVPRHRRHFSQNDLDRLLAAIGECRRACIAANTQAPIGGPIYRAASRLTEEIDLVAELLTGNRRHFWLKPPTSPGSQQPQGPEPDTYDWARERRRAEREREDRTTSSAIWGCS